MIYSVGLLIMRAAIIWLWPNTWEQTKRDRSVAITRNEICVTNLYNNRMRVILGLEQPSGVWTNAFYYDSAKRLTYWPCLDLVDSGCINV